MKGTNVGSVFFEVGYDHKSFGKIVDSSSKNLKNNLGNAFKDTNKAGVSCFKSIAKAAAAVFSVAAVSKFVASSLKIGSALTEVQNVVDVTFRQNSQIINDFAKNSQKQFGISELAAKRYTGTIGAMFKSMGQSETNTLKMSQNMTKLAADIASFYDISTDEAFNKISSGLSGMTIPLKQIGINMSVANLEAYALTQGITTSYDAMSEASKVLLRHNYLLSVTSDAQGDFSRTSSSWANQTRILRLQWESFKASMGAAFIAALTPVLQGLNYLIERMVMAAQVFSVFVKSITGFKNESNGAGVAAKAAASMIGDIGDEAMESANKTVAANKKASRALASFDELNVLTSPSSDESGGKSDISVPALDIGEIVQLPQLNNVEKMFEDLKIRVDSFLNSFRNIAPINSLVSNIKKAFERIGKAMTPLLKPLSSIGFHFGEIFMTNLSAGIRAGAGIMESSVNGIVNVIASGAELAASIARPAFESLSKFFAENSETIKTDIINGWQNIETDTRSFVDSTTGYIQTVWGGMTEWFTINNEEVETLFSGTWSAISSMAGATWAGMQAGASVVFGGIGDFLGKHMTEIKDSIIGVWNMIWDIISPIWNTITETIKTVFNGIKDFFIENGAKIREIVSGAFEIIWILIKKVLDQIKKFWDTWGETIMAAVNGVLNGLKATFLFIWNGIKNSVEMAINAIRNIINIVLAVLKGDWGAAWDGIKKLFTDAWDGMKKSMSNIGDFIKNIFVNVKNTLKNVWDGIVNVFRAPINTILGFINKLIKAWNSLGFKVPKIDLGVLGSFGGFDIGLPKIPEIPMMAKGGVVSQPTLAMIGEGRSSEAVLPLDSNAGWVTTLADAILAGIEDSEIIGLLREMLSAILDGKNINVDGNALATVVTNRLNSNFRATGRTTIRI